MKRKTIIACFFTAVMLLVPLTVVAGEADIENADKTNNKFEIELTYKDYYKIYNSFISFTGENHELNNAIKETFNDAVSISRKGVVNLDLLVFVNILQPILENELLLINSKNNFGLPSVTNQNGPSVGEGEPIIWGWLRSMIDTLPPWREDNDLEDIDGPEEKGQDDGHAYRGLDDKKDWNAMYSLIELNALGLLPQSILYISITFALTVCFPVFIIFLILAGFQFGSNIAGTFFEAFDFMDVPYGHWKNIDGY